MSHPLFARKGTDHPIVPNEPNSKWTWCKTCGRDVNGNHSRHLRTKDETIAKRLGES